VKLQRSFGRFNPFYEGRSMDFRLSEEQEMFRKSVRD